MVQLNTRKSSYRWQIRATRKHAKNCCNSTCSQHCRWQYWSILICLGCFVRNLRNPEKFTENSNLWSSRSSKVIDFGVNWKRICNFINSTLDVSPAVFEILTHLATKSLVSPLHHCLMLLSGGMPCTVNIIYTSLKCTFSWLQGCRRHYGSIFIHLALVAFQSRDITRNSDKNWPYSSLRSSIFVSIESS